MEQKKRFNIFINEASGTVADIGKSQLERLIFRSDLQVEHIYFLPADELLEKIEDYDEDLPILIGGGDGTIKSCAACLLNKKIPFGFLPLGTMNLLAKDLNIPVDIEEAINAYASGTRIFEMDAGKVNDEIFLCCVGLGTMPETSEYREQNRSDSHPILIPKLTAYILKQMDHVNSKKLTLCLDGQRKMIRTSALVVSNNQYGPQGQWNDENFRRISLQDGMLGIYSASPRTIWDRLRFLLRLGLGDWKKDESLQEWASKELSIMSEKERELLSLDGETMELATPLQFSMLPKQLKVLTPIESKTSDTP